ncbi:SDR family oxidoreductase [Streptomyces sp. SID8361]|uniref:SDR family oxidoreductase n=1 Tax=Streptomyces sp. MnatMP-M27 TaxID=1839768 RepID=UPI000D1AA0FF|nr:SDR family oxidoreductase [Streptomyces sp. MnatMP-M27]MYU10036.1 SDR family oxidoreductase [Streptomyces sp. SID8361]
MRRWRALSPLLAAGIPAERVSAPDEVTATVSWLVSDAAGDVRGAEIPVDGGIRSARLR